MVSQRRSRSCCILTCLERSPCLSTDHDTLIVVVVAHFPPHSENSQPCCVELTKCLLDMGVCSQVSWHLTKSHYTLASMQTCKMMPLQSQNHPPYIEAGHNHVSVDTEDPKCEKKHPTQYITSSSNMNPRPLASTREKVGPSLPRKYTYIIHSWP